MGQKQRKNRILDSDKSHDENKTACCAWERDWGGLGQDILDGVVREVKQKKVTSELRKIRKLSRPYVFGIFK